MTNAENKKEIDVLAKAKEDFCKALEDLLDKKNLNISKLRIKLQLENEQNIKGIIKWSIL